MASEIAVNADCVFGQRVHVFDISMQLWVSQPDIALHVSAESGRIFAGHSFSGPTSSRYLQGPICRGLNYESLMHADLYRVASSLFRIGFFLPSTTNWSCSFSRGVLTVFAFALHPDSLMMSGACLKSGSLSSFICPNSKHTVSTTESLSPLNLRIQVLPCLSLCSWI